MSSMVMESKSAESWKRKPMRLRMGSSLWSLRLSMRCPSKKTLPASGRMRPTMCLRRTDLPDPDGPRMTVVRSGSMSSVRLSMTVVLLNALESSSSLTMGPVCGLGGGVVVGWPVVAVGMVV